MTIAGGLGTLARYGISSCFHGNALPWATVAGEPEKALVYVAASVGLGIAAAAGGCFAARALLH